MNTRLRLGAAGGVLVVLAGLVGALIANALNTPASSKQPGDVVTVRYERNGRSTEARLTLATQP